MCWCSENSVTLTLGIVNWVWGKNRWKESLLIRCGHCLEVVVKYVKANMNLKTSEWRSILEVREDVIASGFHTPDSVWCLVLILCATCICWLNCLVILLPYETLNSLKAVTLTYSSSCSLCPAQCLSHNRYSVILIWRN